MQDVASVPQFPASVDDCVNSEAKSVVCAGQQYMVL